MPYVWKSEYQSFIVAHGFLMFVLQLPVIIIILQRAGGIWKMLGGKVAY